MYKILHIPTGEYRFFTEPYETSFLKLIDRCCHTGNCPKNMYTEDGAFNLCNGCCWFMPEAISAEYLIELIPENNPDFTEGELNGF